MRTKNPTNLNELVAERIQQKLAKGMYLQEVAGDLFRKVGRN
jgi:hypothetical protein